MFDEEYKLKENIGYNEELCETIPFKVCSLEQMIYQTEESLHPEEILTDEYDIAKIKRALRITQKFLETAKETGCWFED